MTDRATDPPGVRQMLDNLTLLTRLLAVRNPWPGWSPLATPALLSLAEGGNLLLGVAEPPPGFRPVALSELDSGTPFLRDAPIWCRPGFVDATSIVPGTLSGSYRTALLDNDLDVPVVQLATGPSRLVEVGLLARALFRTQVAIALAAGLDVRVGIGEDELTELLESAASSLNAPNERLRIVGFLLEMQQSYERYPETSLLNNVLGNLEGRMLYGHLTGDGFAGELAAVDGAAPARALARAFALARRERYGAEVPPAQVAYERRIEVSEGLPRFVELSLFQSAAAADDMIPDQQAAARRLFAARAGMLPQVNQRGWGAARRRFYHTGMALGFLLDAAVPAWRADVADGHAPLDTVLESVVEYDGGQTDERALEMARQRYGYFARLDDERAWTRDVEGRRRALIAGILDGKGTRVSIDVAALAERSAWCDPASLERIGESVLVHVRPGAFTYGDGSTFVEFRGLSVIEDQRSKLLHANLPGPVPRISGDDEDLPMIKGVEFTEGLEVELGGLKVRGRRGTVSRDGNVLFIRLLE